MVRPVRLVAFVTLLCALLATPALAQRPFDSPRLRDRPVGGFNGQATATPTAEPTVTAEPTATATATVSPRRRTTQLAETGADPLRLVLAGLALLGFGLALRFRVALADAGRHDRLPL